MIYLFYFQVCNIQLIRCWHSWLGLHPRTDLINRKCTCVWENNVLLSETMATSQTSNHVAIGEWAKYDIIVKKMKLKLGHKIVITIYVSDIYRGHFQHLSLSSHALNQGTEYVTETL